MYELLDQNCCMNFNTDFSISYLTTLKCMIANTQTDVMSQNYLIPNILLTLPVYLEQMTKLEKSFNINLVLDYFEKG